MHFLNHLGHYIHEVYNNVHCNQASYKPSHVHTHLLIIDQIGIHSKQVAHRENGQLIVEFKGSCIGCIMGLNSCEEDGHEEGLQDDQLGLEGWIGTKEDYGQSEQESSEHIEGCE